MSQANVEVVLTFLDAYSRGDYEALLQFCSPDVEGYPDVSVFPEPRPRVGHAELQAFFEEIGSAWAAPPRYVVTEMVPAEGDRVLVRGEWVGKGAASGIESRSEWSIIFTIRDSQIARIAWLSDHVGALKAVGLGE